MKILLVMDHQQTSSPLIVNIIHNSMMTIFEHDTRTLDIIKKNIQYNSEILWLWIQVQRNLKVALSICLCCIKGFMRLFGTIMLSL